MSEGWKFIVALLLSTFLHPAFSQVYPERYTFLTGTSVNGSSLTANCSNVSMDDTMTTCLQPTSSVLFDGHAPTLTGLDGDMWASQLLTINTMEFLTNVIFNFTDTPGYDRVERVEVVMFNCPQWGIASTVILLLGATARGQPFNTFNSIRISSLTSCESLVRVCLSAIVSRPILGLQFIHDQDSNWVHLAEVTFNTRNSTCPPNVILTPPPPTTPPVTTPQVTKAPVTTPPVITAPDFTIEARTCTNTTILSVVLTAILTALLATVIFVAVLVVVCKYQLKSRPGRTGTGITEGEQVYEQMGRDEGGVAVRGGTDPMYMEVGGRKGHTFQLKENEAYGTHS